MPSSFLHTSMRYESIKRLLKQWTWNLEVAIFPCYVAVFGHNAKSLQPWGTCQYFSAFFFSKINTHPIFKWTIKFTEKKIKNPRHITFWSCSFVYIDKPEPQRKGALSLNLQSLLLSVTNHGISHIKYETKSAKKVLFLLPIFPPFLPPSLPFFSTQS